MARSRAGRRHSRRTAGARRRAGGCARRSFRRSLDVRHGGAARSGRRRPAAHEPARRSAGGGRAGPVPARHRSRRNPARRCDRLRRSAQERCLRLRHSTRDGRLRHPGDAVRSEGPHTGTGVVDHRGRGRRRRRRHGVAQPARRQRLQGVPRRQRPDRATPRCRDLGTHRAGRPHRCTNGRQRRSSDRIRRRRADRRLPGGDPVRAEAARRGRRSGCLHSDARCRRCRRAARVRGVLAFRRRTSSPSSSSRTARFPPCRSPIPRNRARWIS